MENRSGNRNTKGGFPTVATQEDRAASAHRSLLELVRLPFVMGVDWFQYYDEPPAGRFDGEDFNMGLVDINDRPYEKLVSNFSSTKLVEMRGMRASPRLDVSSGVPPSPADPVGLWNPYEALRDWDRERGFVPAQSTAPFADFYLAWNYSEIWLGLYAMDLTERDYYKDRVVPEVDRMHWRLEIDGMEPAIEFRIGAALQGVYTEHRALENGEFWALAHNTRVIAAVRIPAAVLGKARLKPGDTIELKSILDAHARSDRVSWSGRFTLVE